VDVRNYELLIASVPPPFERNDEGEANVLIGIGEGGKYGYCCNKDKTGELV
jgi:hypothetical protein